MVSEFSSRNGPLEAFLFFFSDAVIADFLAATSRQAVSAPASKTALFAGDERSLRLRENDSRCKDLSADVVITDLIQVLGHIK